MTYMHERFKVALIGLGRIGSAYDASKVVDLPRSHVGAILKNPALELVAVCDALPERRAKFKMDWNLSIPVYETADELLRRTKYDIVVVATSTATHEKILETCVDAAPRIIFCEKPFCDTAVTAARLFKKLAETNIQVVVNYHRRWDPRFSLLRRAIQETGPVRHVDLLYMKGLRNYGSHAIDLLQYLFGPVSYVFPMSRPLAHTEDPSYSAVLEFADDLQVNMIGFDDVDYELLDLDIITQRARFNVDIGGYSIGVRHLEEGLHFDGYTNLKAMQPLIEASPVHGLTHAYEEFVRFLRDGVSILTSPLDNAVGVQRVMDAIVDAAHNRNRVAL